MRYLFTLLSAKNEEKVKEWKLEEVARKFIEITREIEATSLGVNQTLAIDFGFIP